jgi:hypothetical protein
MRTILAGVATWERGIVPGRRREGLAKAKAAGKYKGRPVSIDAAPIKQLSAWTGLRRLPGVAASLLARPTDCPVYRLLRLPTAHLPTAGAARACIAGLVTVRRPFCLCCVAE